MKIYISLLFCIFFFLGDLPLQAQIGLSIQTALDQLVPAQEGPAFRITKKITQAPPPNPPLSLVRQKIPSSYDYDHLGIFCKFEVQLEKKFKVPMKFRLGEVQYTEQLEYGPR